MKILFSVIALFLSNLVYGQYGWIQKASMNVGRYAGVGFSIGNKAYVGTGYNTANQTQSDLWEWDQTTNIWTQKANITNSRFGAAAFVIDGYGYVGLGLTTGLFFNDLQRYDPITNTWTPRASLPSNGRYGSSSFAINNKGYIACGNLGSASGPYSTQLWEYDPILDSWSLKAPFPGTSRYGGRASVINNLAYVIGGVNGTGTSSSSFFTDLWEYNAALNSWSQKLDIPALGRQYPSTFVLDGKLVAGSGVHWTGVLADFYAFDPSTNTWSTLPPLPGPPRWAAVGVNVGTNGYIATGLFSTNITTPEYWELALLNIPPPVITANGADQYVGCNPDQQLIEDWLSDAYVTGGCNAPVAVNTSTSLPVNTSGCYWSVTRTFSATDGCGTVADTVSITVSYKIDEFAPVITPNMSGGYIGCNPDANSIDQQLGDANGIDNCDATVVVNATTTAPVNSDGCYWSVTRNFIATDNCGNTSDISTVTVTYKIDDIAPVITPDQSDITIGCNPSASLIESSLGNATADDNCDASVIVNTSTTNPTNTNGCIWSVTRTFTATDTCGNSATPSTVTVTYKLDNIAPAVTCNANGNITVCDGTSINLTPSAYDLCDGSLSVNCTRSDGLSINDPFNDGITTVTCTSTDVCGNPGSCSITVNVDCENNNNRFCSYTQGAYGTANGAHCDGTNTTIFLAGLLATPLEIGAGNNKFTLTYSDVTSGCFYTRLPGGGASTKLAGMATCSNPVGITLNGNKFKNTLLVQTITFGLNLRIPGSTLGDINLSGQYLTTYASAGTGCSSSNSPQGASAQSYILPASVINYLGVNNKISDLYNLSNLALGGIYTGNSPSKTDIANAINIINNAFDNCRILGSITNTSPVSRTLNVPESNSSLLNVKVYPNPFTEESTINFMLIENGSDVTVDIYNLTGQKAATLFQGYAEPGKDYNIKVDGTSLLPGVYIYYVRTGNGVYFDKLTLIK